MNCPYCDETVHLMSKYCPKCGLPLKEETTVMGGGNAYLTDEAGPTRWIVLAGAGAIVLIALSIGWLNSRKPADVSQSARREPVPVNPAFTRPANPVNPFFNPAAQYGGFSRPSLPSANYSPQVRWAYVPPANPAPVQQAAPNPALQAPEPAPPPMMLASNPFVLPPAIPARVEPARVITPAVPFAETVPEPQSYPAGTVLEPTGAYYNYVPYGPEARPAPPEELNRTWVYDPIQERYVINPERVRGGGIRYFYSPARRNAAPTTGAPINPATTQPALPPVDTGAN